MIYKSLVLEVKVRESRLKVQQQQREEMKGKVVYSIFRISWVPVHLPIIVIIMLRNIIAVSGLLPLIVIVIITLRKSVQVVLLTIMDRRVKFRI